MRTNKNQRLAKRMAYDGDRDVKAKVTDKPVSTKKSTYYICMTEITGVTREICRDDEGNLLNKKDIGVQLLQRLHERDSSVNYDLIRRADGICFGHFDAVHVMPSDQHVGQTRDVATLVRKSTEGKPPVRRPTSYSIEVENLPISLARIKGNKSGRVMSAREVSVETNPLNDRTREGESRKFTSVGKTTEDKSSIDTFVFDTWGGAYFFCVDVKDNLKTQGYKSTGNYKQAIWKHAKGSNVVRVTFNEHLEKVLTSELVSDSSSVDISEMELSISSEGVLSLA